MKLIEFVLMVSSVLMNPSLAKLRIARLLLDLTLDEFKELVCGFESTCFCLGLFYSLIYMISN